MDVYLHVYSPRNKSINSQALLPDIKKMITAQKKFLGNINTTKKYAILVYITSMNNDDAKGLGALEHNTSTTATFKDDMKITELIHVISHEFFHTLTPLKVHSKEIHDFDFNQPQMSQHLWMYEGFTEYFANLFQVKEGLIDASVFYNTMSEKLLNSRTYFKDDLSFTEMSKNVLVPAMKKQYPNVYEKGALMAMCLDVIIRDKSNGKRGILSVMGELSQIYGPTRPFDDNAFIAEFTKITYPEVGDFLQTHIVKGVPINYNEYLSKVGVSTIKVQIPVKIAFYFDNKMFLKMDEKKNVYIDAKDGSNEFIKAIGFENNDQVIELNGIPVNGEDINKLMMPVYGLEVGAPFKAKIIRNGSEKQLSGSVKLNTSEGDGFRYTDTSKQALNQLWLKG
jgi:predicted metalloprotease with PDZ domain